MNAIRLLLVVLIASPTLAACGKSACEKAIDKEIECEEDPDEKKMMKEAKDFAVAFCKGDQSKEQKAELDCYKKDSCGEIEVCKASIRGVEEAKEVAAQVAAGKWDDAITTCSYGVENYTAVPAFKEACDKALTDGLSKVEYPSLTCDKEDFLKVSEAAKAACTKMADELGKKVVAARDSGADSDYMLCSNYKDLAKVAGAETVKAAEQLCAEADVADDAKEALDEAKANLAKKEADIPFKCKYFIEENEAKLTGSAWFEAKSKELAKTCFGDVGKLVLAGVERSCYGDAKDVHAFAAKYKLGEADAELAGLLTKTAELCSK